MSALRNAYIERVGGRGKGTPRFQFKPAGRDLATKLLTRGCTLRQIAAGLKISVCATRRLLKLDGLATSAQQHPFSTIQSGLISRAGSRFILTDQGRAKLWELVSQGLSGCEIAPHFGTSMDWIYGAIAAEGLRTLKSEKQARRTRLGPISDAEQDRILEWTVQGLTDSDIADRLGIRTNIIITYRSTHHLRIRLKRDASPADRAEREKLTAASIKHVLEHLDRLWAHHCKPTTVSIMGLGFTKPQALSLKRLWIVNRGLDEQYRRGPAPIRDYREIRGFLPKELHYLPFTALDERNVGRHGTPQLNVVRYLIATLDDEVRNISTLFYFVAVDQYINHFSLYTSTINNTASLLKIKKALPHGTSLCAVEIEDFLFKVCTHQIDVGLSDSALRTLLGWWRTVSHKVHDYIQRLTPEQQADLQRWMLPPLQKSRALVTLKWWKTFDEQTRQKRKALTDVVHRRFYELRFAAGVRLNGVRRLHHAFLEACQAATNGKTLPLRIEYEERCIDFDGREVEQIVTFEVWDHRCLRTMLGFHSRRPSRSSKHFYLLFCGVRPKVAGQAPIVPWWVEFLEKQIFSFSLANREGRRQFNESWGYRPDTFWAATSGGMDVELPPSHRHAMIEFRKRGYCVVPIGMFYRLTLTSAFVIQFMTKTGARVGEVQQVAASPNCLAEVCGVGSQNGTRYAIRVIPKGRREREDKYIDEETWKLLVEIVKLHRDSYGTKRVPIVDPDITSKHKLKPDRYVLQVNRQILNSETLNKWLRISLHPILVDPQTGRSIQLVSHLLRHAFATELGELNVEESVIAKLLSHKNAKVTKYYSEPTKQRVRAAAERIFLNRMQVGRHGVRTPEEVDRLLKEAEGKIGALTDVAGGTCVVANMCPVKFACIGCAGNAPDPRKRHQVLDKKAWAKQQKEWASKEGLIAEVRQFERLVADCDDMLREMDLIEKANMDADAPIALKYPKT